MEQLWKDFLNSGAVEDYLKYRSAANSDIDAGDNKQTGGTEKWFLR